MDDVTRIEWFDDRYYPIPRPKEFGDAKWSQSVGDGRFYYNSTTTFLNIINKPFLSLWRGKIGNFEAEAIVNRALNKGSRIHAGINKGLMEGAISFKDELGRILFTQEEWLQIIRFAQFMEVVKPQVLGSEVVSCSHVQETAGTVDLPCVLQAGEYALTKSTVRVVPETGLYIGDIKTGGKDKNYHLQTAHYAIQLEEMNLFGMPIVGTFVLYLDAGNKSGFDIDIRTKEQMKRDGELSIFALELWRYNNPNNTPTVFTMPDRIDFGGRSLLSGIPVIAPVEIEKINAQIAASDPLTTQLEASIENKNGKKNKKVTA